jgi:dolichyl-phosphate beta-glucosyltransferase
MSKISDDLLLSLIIPAYNEEKRIGPSLAQIITYFQRNRCSYELIVVDDGSTDRTVELVRELIAETQDGHLLHAQHGGKGAAVRKGILSAKGQYIFFTDADLSTPITELDKFLEQFNQGYDIVIGSRKITGANVEVHQSWLREFMSKVFIWLTNLILTKNISDVTCGFKGFTHSAAQKVFAIQRVNDWSFDAEILFLAQKYGYTVKEVPVHWRNDPGTKVRLWKDVIRSFLGLLKIRANDWMGEYESQTFSGEQSANE